MGASFTLDYETSTDPVTRELGPKIGIDDLELDYVNDLVDVQLTGGSAS